MEWGIMVEIGVMMMGVMTSRITVVEWECN